MRWGGFYFPKKSNLTLLSSEQKSAIQKAVNLLKEANLPYLFYKNVEKVSFYVDSSLANSYILGHTTFFRPNRMVLNPIISNALLWTNSSGVPNNEMPMETIVHELTHLQQFRMFRWYGWMIVHLPILNRYTVEKWANKNGEAARLFLSRKYRLKTKTNLLRKISIVI